MRNAPAVRFPVARSLFAAWLLVMLWAVGAVSTLMFAASPNQPTWIFAAALPFCLVLGFLALAHWRKSPVGVLSWDRKQWQIAFGSPGLAEPVALLQVSVRLDLQSTMLATFCTSSGQRLWIWMDKGADGARWRKLRQAIFSRPRLKGPEDVTGSKSDHGVAG